MSLAKLVTVAFGDPCWDIHADPASSETVCILQNKWGKLCSDQSNSMPEPRSSSLSLCCLHSNPILNRGFLGCVQRVHFWPKGANTTCFPPRGSFWPQPTEVRREGKAPSITRLREPRGQREIAGQHSPKMTFHSHLKTVSKGIWLLLLSGLSLSPLPHLPTMPLPYPISQIVVSGQSKQEVEMWLRGKAEIRKLVSFICFRQYIVGFISFTF